MRGAGFWAACGAAFVFGVALGTSGLLIDLAAVFIKNPPKFTII